jgi:hypothetical protein
MKRFDGKSVLVTGGTQCTTGSAQPALSHLIVTEFQ